MNKQQDERVAWFHCFSGIAGDMALGSLIDAGAPLTDLRAVLDLIPIGGWQLEVSKVLRAGITGTRVNVVVEDRSPIARPYGAIVELLDKAGLPKKTGDRAASIFKALAGVEAAVHGLDVKDVHFHEVGGHDALIDIVGVAACLELLNIDVVESSPVAQGIGTINSRHGILPNPAPAVVALLHDAPVYGRDIALELTTPTGAAILAALAQRFGPMPAMSITASGFGAGGRDLDGLPNLTQVIIGERTSTGLVTGEQAGQPLVLLETNLDDATGEQLADAQSAVLKAGAADCWITPVLMKKGRPGHILSVLADFAHVPALRQIMLDETGSFGVRANVVDRFAQRRDTSTVDVDGHAVRVKIGPGRVKIEHDDARHVAEALGLSTKEVIRRAEAAFAEQQSRSDGLSG